MKTKMTWMFAVLLILLLGLGACQENRPETNEENQNIGQTGSIIPNPTDKYPSGTGTTEGIPVVTNPPQTTPPVTNPPQTTPQGTNPPQTTPPETDPPQIEDTRSDEELAQDYYEYKSMTALEQWNFIMSFASTDDFYAWLDEAKAAYQRVNPDIIIDGEEIEIN